MPRYFFYIHDGIELDDRSGVELAGLEQAIQYAQNLAAEIAATPFFADGRNWKWSMRIRDEAGDAVHSISFLDYAPPPKPPA